MTCPTNPAHGRVYDVGPDRWFCSHSDHDKGDRTKCLFTEEEVMSGHVNGKSAAPAPRKRGRRK